MTYKTALIVDDSKLARITLRKKLEQRGLSVEMAESGVQALEFLTNNSVDIVFMDHLMPELDGFETTKKIKSNPSTTNIPVIMCTGKEYEGYLQEARAIGAANILSKPPENDALDLILAEKAPTSNEKVAEASPVMTNTVQEKSSAAHTGLSESDIETVVSRLLNDKFKTEIASELAGSVSSEVSAQQQQKMEQLNNDLTTRLNTLDGAIQSIESNAEQAKDSGSPDELQGVVKALVASEVAKIGPSQLSSLVDLSASNSTVDEAQLKEVQDTVERLTAQMVDMDSRIDELSNKTSTLKEAFTTLSESNSTASTPAENASNDSLYQELAVLSQQVEELNQQTEALKAESTSQAEAQAQVIARVDEQLASQQSQVDQASEFASESEANQLAASAIAALDEFKLEVEQRLAAQDAVLTNGDNIPTVQPEIDESNADQPQLGNNEDLNFDTRSDLQHQLLGDNHELKASLGKMKMLAGGGLALAIVSLLAQFF